MPGSQVASVGCGLRRAPGRRAGGARRSTSSTRRTSSSRSTRTSSASARARSATRRISRRAAGWARRATSSTGCTSSSRCRRSRAPTPTIASRSRRATFTRLRRRSRPASAPRARRAAGTLSDDAQKWITAVAADLQAHKGRSAVVAGDRQPAAVHALARAMNEALGNVGTTVTYTAPIAASPADGAASLAELVGRHERRQGRRARSSSAATRCSRRRRICNFGEALDKVGTARSPRASITTRPPSCATGTCRKRTTSSRGATCAASTARSR